MKTSFNSLRKAVFQGAIEKFNTLDDSILDEINYELSTIEQLKLSYYFLNYKTIVDICNDEGWLRSPGRGRATSSLVNYCLDITNLNPIEFGLHFESFINLDHYSGIDIDIDIPTGKRVELLKLLQDKLIDCSIRQIVYSPLNSIDNHEILIHKGIEYAKHPFALVITPSHQSVEIETIGIANQKYLTLTESSKNRKLISPFRYDIISNDYLSFLQKIIAKLDKTEQPNSINTLDSATYNLLISGHTEDIFQFSGSGITEILQAFKPSSVLDLAIINAVYRPGLAQKIPKLIEYKTLGYKIPFPSDIRISKILAETFGLLIFQESFIDIVTQIAGFKETEAVYFLRVLCQKKELDLVNLFKIQFVDGCRLNSTLKFKEIQLLANMLIMDGPYTFQKSHSISYSMIGFWGAYYKTHYRSEFDYCLLK